MPEERPFIVFRKYRGNRFTLPVLLGCIEEKDLVDKFQILIANSREEIVQKVKGEKAIIAYSFMTPNLEQVLGEIEWLRKCLSSQSLFLAGGAHATGDPEGTLELGFDFVFVGEAEETFPEFLRCFLGGSLPSKNLFWAERKPGHCLSHPPHSLLHRFFAPMEITRGCLYSCTFCQTPRVFGHALRHREPENVAVYLKQAIPYGYRESKFISPNAFSYGANSPEGPNLTEIENFLTTCKEAGIEGIHFGCFPSEVRPEWVTPDVLGLVRRYCRNRTIVLGAQTGSDPLLERLKRGHTAEHALNAARQIRQAGFRPHVDFVFGFPGETLEDRRATLTLIQRMIEDWGAKIHGHTFMPLPGTPLFRENPSVLDEATKDILLGWEKKKGLDGWWKEQETIAWKIVEWRDRGLVQGKDKLDLPLES